jgi:membrane-associated HD superfamily phosphohydrolase
MSDFRYRTDIPYASLVMAVGTLGVGGLAAVVSLILRDLYGKGSAMSMMPWMVFIFGYLAMICYYRTTRRKDRHYDTSTILISVVNSVVCMVLGVNVLFADPSLLFLPILFCNFLALAFYANYFVICLVLWIAPNRYAPLSLVGAVVAVYFSISKLPS